MKRLAMLGFLLGGCIQVGNPDEQRRAEFYARNQARHEENRKRFEEEKRQAEANAKRRQAEQRAEVERKAAEKIRRAEEQKEAEAKATASACAEDRDGRKRRLEAHLASYEERSRLLQWESAHCKIVDRGKPVVREYERPDGTLVRKRIISGYPERVCDGPTPKGLPPWRTGASRDTQGLVRLSEQDARLNDLCLDDDLAAGWDHVDHGEEETSNH